MRPPILPSMQFRKQREGWSIGLRYCSTTNLFYLKNGKRWTCNCNSFRACIHSSGLLWETSVLDRLWAAQWRNLCHRSLRCKTLLPRVVSCELDFGYWLKMSHLYDSTDIHIWSYISSWELQHLQALGWILGQRYFIFQLKLTNWMFISLCALF